MLDAHLLVHRGNSLLEARLERRDLVAHFVFLKVADFGVRHDCLQLADAIRGLLAVLAEVLNLASSLCSRPCPVHLVLDYRQLLLIMLSILDLLSVADGQNGLIDADLQIMARFDPLAELLGWHRALRLYRALAWC